MQNGKVVFVSAVTDVHTTDKEGVGTLRWVRDANGWKCYRYVRNSSGGALAVGSVVVHGTAGFSITTGANPSTFEEEVFKAGQGGKGALIQFLAGVAVSAPADGNYCWIQVYGYHAAVVDEGTVAVVVGDSLKAVSGQLYAVHDTAPGVIGTVSKRTIYALTADAGGAGQHTVAGYIMCI